MNSDAYTHGLQLARIQLGDTATRTLARALGLRDAATTAPARYSRADLSAALALCLLHDLLQRVPSAERYLQRVLANDGHISLDHGALRTVAWPSGQLPPGEAAITRFLTALGYECAELYPLPQLRMTGRAYRHRDLPDTLPQYFVSELHPEQFSGDFQLACTRVLASSRDPWSPADLSCLEALRRDQTVLAANALPLLVSMQRSFSRLHEEPSLDDYNILLAESAEMAWIATEGTVFNHATDRVADVQQLADTLRGEGYAVKDRVEVSRSGRVRQTALRADLVRRRFTHKGRYVTLEVPGSFFEFISRDLLPPAEVSTHRIDLSFDSGNATGIFSMTRDAKLAA
jgi:hypothetical protein